jgi:hypothetical protein
LLSLKQQSDLNELNLERARRGQPPLNVSQYAAQSAPQVRAGLTPDTQSLLIYGGAALAGVWLLSSFIRKR